VTIFEAELLRWHFYIMCCSAVLCVLLSIPLVSQDPSSDFRKAILGSMKLLKYDVLTSNSGDNSFMIEDKVTKADGKLECIPHTFLRSSLLTHL
jgi:hypothetical protein